MALRDHWRGDQNIDLAIAESAENALKIAHMPHRVAIHTANARVRIEGFQLRLEPFRSLTHVVNVLAVAFLAAHGWMAGKTTIVAKQLVDRTVIGQRDTTRTALKGEATTPA